MTDELTREETLQIKISRFGTTETKEKVSTIDTNKENIFEENTVKISIERKSKIINSSDYNKEEGDKWEFSMEKKNKISNPKSEVVELINADNDKGLKNISTVTNILKMRKDFYGNPILKGQNKKLQKVTFVDYLKKESSSLSRCKKMDFVEIVDIESYKNYNEDISLKKKPKKIYQKKECCGNCIFV